MDRDRIRGDRWRVKQIEGRFIDSQVDRYVDRERKREREREKERKTKRK